MRKGLFPFYILFTDYLGIQACQDVICSWSSTEHRVLKDKPAGATEILFETSTTAPQPFVLFSQLQELTVHRRKRKHSKPSND